MAGRLNEKAPVPDDDRQRYWPPAAGHEKCDSPADIESVMATSAENAPALGPISNAASSVEICATLLSANPFFHSPNFKVDDRERTGTGQNIARVPEGSVDCRGAPSGTVDAVTVPSKATERKRQGTSVATNGASIFSRLAEFRFGQPASLSCHPPTRPSPALSPKQLLPRQLTGHTLQDKHAIKMSHSASRGDPEGAPNTSPAPSKDQPDSVYPDPGHHETCIHPNYFDAPAPEHPGLEFTVLCDPLAQQFHEFDSGVSGDPFQYVQPEQHVFANYNIRPPEDAHQVTIQPCGYQANQYQADQYQFGQHRADVHHPYVQSANWCIGQDNMAPPFESQVPVYSEDYDLRALQTAPPTPREVAPPAAPKAARRTLKAPDGTPLPHVCVAIAKMCEAGLEVAGRAELVSLHQTSETAVQDAFEYAIVVPLLKQAKTEAVGWAQDLVYDGVEAFGAMQAGLPAAQRAVGPGPKKVKGKTVRDSEGNTVPHITFSVAQMCDTRLAWADLAADYAMTKAKVRDVFGSTIQIPDLKNNDKRRMTKLASVRKQEWANGKKAVLEKRPKPRGKANRVLSHAELVEVVNGVSADKVLAGKGLEMYLEGEDGEEV